MNMAVKLIGLIFFLMLLQCTAFAAGLFQNTQALNETIKRALSNTNEITSNVNPLRASAMKKAALQFGIQSGRYYRWQTIIAGLWQRDHQLSTIYNFSRFYLDNGKLQPPILDESKNSLAVTRHGNKREAIEAVYRVIAHAQFVTRPLNWQLFLIPNNLNLPPKPNPLLLPRNADETGLWKGSIVQGFNEGVGSANAEFSARLNQLQHDYQGMALYVELAMRGMIAPPKIQHYQKTMGTQNKKTIMAVGISESVIAQGSYFIGKPYAWKPVYFPNLQGK